MLWVGCDLLPITKLAPTIADCALSSVNKHNGGVKMPISGVKCRYNKEPV